MNNLKELTKEQHKSAERSEFVKVLISGNINPELYATYLWNQYVKYKELENLADRYVLLTDLQGIRRTKKIYSDFLELWNKPGVPVTFPSTIDYISHIRTISNKQNLLAHIYVHHMGDMSGGQIISKRVPGGCKMYHFTRNIDDLKNALRNKLTDELAEEAIISFKFAIKLFDDLMTADIAPYKIY